ncbi:MAG: YfhO family protein [Oscillospiraceae bacterium]|nr:YfhO family protein [Oscillospiraceae bacterium]
MKNKQRRLLKTRSMYKYFISPVIVMLIYLLIFALKGIYPFGERIIDVWDMTQMNVPIYYHLWDFLHGSKALFFDWYSGLSINMAESVGIVSLLSPFNLFFFFVSREKLHLSMGLFTILKLMAAAATMYFFLKKTYVKSFCLSYVKIRPSDEQSPSFGLISCFALSEFWLNIFSLSYAFSGYAIMYYSNSQWLDIMAIFPLLMHSLYKLLRGKKGGTLYYIIMLCVCLIINMYISMMVLLFIFFISGFYFKLISKYQRKQIVCLGAGTLMSFAISAAVTIPCFVQIDESARSTLGRSLVTAYLSIMNAPNGISMNKWLLLFPCALPLSIIVIGIFGGEKFKSKSRGFKKIAAFWGGGILLVLLPLFFETTNLIWHGGGYVLFPVRFSFMLTFMVITAASYYASRNPAINKYQERIAEEIPDFSDENDYDDYDDFDSYGVVDFSALSATDANELKSVELDGGGYTISKVMSFILTFATIFFMGCTAYISVKKTLSFYKEGTNVFAPELFTPIIVLSVILFTVYLFLFCKYNTKINNRIVGFILLLELFCFSYIYIGYQNPPFAYIREANEVKREFSVSEDKLARIKTTGHSFNTNYPFIFERASISNWTHTIPYRRLSANEKFGYSTVYTRMLDTGGTVFSDALFNITNTISDDALPSALYELIADGESYSYYKNRYVLPFGIPVSLEAMKTVIVPVDETAAEKEPERELENSKATEKIELNPFIYSNAVYANMFSKNDELFDIIKYNGIINEVAVMKHEATDKKLSVSINVVGRKVLYYLSSNNNKTGSLKIKSKSNGTVEVKRFPSQFDNGVLCLGVFENETVSLDITKSDTVKATSAYYSPNAVKAEIVAQLDLEKMDALINEWAEYDIKANAGANTLSIEANIDDANNDLLFLPISYDKGWRCKVNGERVKVRRILGSFIGIPVEAGGNNIEMRFISPGFIPGAIISLCAVVSLLAFLLVLRKVKQEISPKDGRILTSKKIRLIERHDVYQAAVKGIFALYMIIWGGLVMVIYLIPTAYSLISKFLIL